jgi:hypothetical protein
MATSVWLREGEHPTGSAGRIGVAANFCGLLSRENIGDGEEKSSGETCKAKNSKEVFCYRLNP